MALIAYNPQGHYYVNLVCINLVHLGVPLINAPVHLGLSDILLILNFIMSLLPDHTVLIRYDILSFLHVGFMMFS